MKEKIKLVIFNAIDEVNEQLEKKDQLEKSKETIFFW